MPNPVAIRNTLVSWFFQRPKPVGANSSPKTQEYQPTIADLQLQVQYYTSPENNIGLQNLCIANPSIKGLIEELPSHVNESNRLAVQTQLMQVSGEVIGHQLKSADPTKRTLSLQCMSYLDKYSIQAIQKKFAAPHSLESLQMNGGALLSLPPEISNLNLDQIYLNNNLFKIDLSKYKSNDKAYKP